MPLKVVLDERIPLAGPWITELEVRYVAEATRGAWYAAANDWQLRFEANFAAWLGVGHAVSVPHGTAALHLALLGLGVGSGDEVIVPDLTWIASAAPISYVGATPVFADVDPATWCLDPRSVRRCLSRRTRAIIAVDLYGSMPDMAGLEALAREHGVALIEDAAEALGSTLGGRLAGSFGRAGAFSFHGSKTLTTGEGGMVVSDDPALDARMRFLRDHGRPPGDRLYQNAEVAYKYKMSALQAALGLAQLERIEAILARKRAIFGWYSARLGGEPRIALNPRRAELESSYWLVTAVLEAAPPVEWLMAHFDAEGIDTRPFFRPLSGLPAYRDSPPARRAETPAGRALAPRGINLPSALSLTEAQVDRVCQVLRRALE